MEFIFSSPWIFLGMLILSALWLKVVAVIILGLAAIVRGNGNINIS